MALTADVIISLEEARGFLELETTAKDLILEALINGTTQAFNIYTGRALKETTHTAELLEYDGSGLFYLPNYPVKEISELKLNDQALTEDEDFMLNAQAGILRLPRAAGLLEITYTAGYEELPADLKLAALKQVSYEYQQTIQKAWGVQSRSQAGSATTYSEKGLLPQVKEILDRYRRMI